MESILTWSKRPLVDSQLLLLYILDKGALEALDKTILEYEMYLTQIPSKC